MIAWWWLLVAGLGGQLVTTAATFWAVSLTRSGAIEDEYNLGYTAGWEAAYDADNRDD